MAKLRKKPTKFKKTSKEKIKVKKRIAKKQEKEKILPKNSRFITEQVVFKKKPKLKSFVLPIIYLLFISLLVVVGVDAYKKGQMYLSLSSEKMQINSEIKELERKTSVFPSYKEGFLRLSILEYRLGEFEKARKYIRRALILDPNFKNAQDFAKKIGEPY